MPQYAYRSLMDHLGSGKEWDLDRKYDGLTIFPPFLSADEEHSGWYKGTADALYTNLSYLRKSNEEYVVIADGNMIYRMDFKKILKAHREKGADITLVYREMNDYPSNELSKMTLLSLNGEWVSDIQDKPLHPKSNLGHTGVILIKRELLITMVEDALSHGNYSILKDVIAKKLDAFKVYGYKYEGYWRIFGSMNQYYRCNMELLQPDVYSEMFLQDAKVFTKVKDEAPAKYNEEAFVRNSIIADGCIIEGTVENCVLFRGVTVKKGACLKNSIVMQNSVIEENSSIECAVIDKDAKVTSGKNLKGEDNLPIYVAKKKVV